MAPHELAAYLLQASGQEEDTPVNPSSILDPLGLAHLSLGFAVDLPEAVSPSGERPRALLSLPERVIATDRQLTWQRARFSTFHEIAHYVLPDHVESIVLCTDRDLSHFARGAREREANAFAADLLFHAVRFSLEANSSPITAATVKELADRYLASYEATARRLVEKNLRPCMLLVYAPVANDKRIDIARAPRWDVRYSVASPTFSCLYFARVRSNVDNPYVLQVATADRDIPDSVTAQEAVNLPDGCTVHVQTEYFFNQYNVFCLLRPLGEAVPTSFRDPLAVSPGRSPNART
jgi:hypothetical protein